MTIWRITKRWEVWKTRRKEIFEIFLTRKTLFFWGKCAKPTLGQGSCPWQWKQGDLLRTQWRQPIFRQVQLSSRPRCSFYACGISLQHWLPCNDTALVAGTNSPSPSLTGKDGMGWVGQIVFLLVYWSGLTDQEWIAGIKLLVEITKYSHVIWHRRKNKYECTTQTSHKLLHTAWKCHNSSYHLHLSVFKDDDTTRRSDVYSQHIKLRGNDEWYSNPAIDPWSTSYSDFCPHACLVVQCWLP